MQRILPWLARNIASMIGFRRRKPSHSDQFAPHFYVRTLEERRVLNAAPVAPPAAPTPAPAMAPPPTSTLVTLDSSHNLLIQDVSAGGQNDSLTIRADAANGRYEIHDSTNTLVTDIAGATGSGSQTIYIPFAAVAGDKIIVDAAGGDDALTVDYSGGELPQSIEYLGGAGEDALSLVGGELETVSYTFTSAGSGQIQTSISPQSSTISFADVEPIGDQLVVDHRGFTLVGSASSALLASDTNGNLLLDLQNGSSVTFADARVSLAISADTLVVGGQLSFTAQDVQLTALDRFHLESTGQITSPGGSVSVFAPDLQIDGTIRSAGGQITLDALDQGTLRVTGVIDVSDTSPGGVGGSVHLLGTNVNLLESARVDASGHSGGGEILVGGDYQGASASIRNAEFTEVAENVTLVADGLQTGNGGKIIVWANDTALVAGSGNIRARGGAISGDGGLVETSGKKYVTFGGAVDASAAHGAGGLWLIDPVNVTINAAMASSIETSLNSGTNVTITTVGVGVAAGNITVAAPITVTTVDPAAVELKLIANNDIDVNAAITSTGRQLNLVLTANSDSLGGGDTTIAAAIATNGGDFDSSGVLFTNTAAGTIATAGGDVTLDHTGAVAFGGTVTAGAGDIEVDTAGTNQNITFAGSAKLTAATIDLNSSGNITSTTGAAVLEATAAGGITLVADNLGNSAATPLRIIANSGDLRLTANPGSMYIEISSGDLLFSQIKTLSAGTGGTGTTASIRVTDGTITVDSVAGGVNTANDTLLLSTGGTDKDITFSNTSKLTATSINLSSSGNITVAAGGGTVLETANTGGLTLAADSLGTNTAPLRLDIGTGALALTATTGDIFAVIVDADFSFSQFTTLNAAAVGKTVSLRTNNGAINVNSIAAGVTIADDNLILTTNGTNKDIAFSGASNLTVGTATLSATDDITFAGTSKLTAVSASLTAADDITSSTGATVIETSGAAGLALSADQLGTSPAPLKIVVGTGSISLTALAGDIYVEIASGNLLTSQITTLAATGARTVQLATTDGTITVDELKAGFNTADDDLSLITGGTNHNIVFNDNPALANNTLVAASVLLNSSGTITTTDTTGVDVDTSAANGLITLVADGIGSSANPLVLKPGSGKLNLTTTAGDIYIAVDSINFKTSDITTLSAAGVRTVQISTIDSTITVDKIETGFNALDDNLRLISGGTNRNILFSDNTANTLTAASVYLDASGNIINADTSGININTSAADGEITLKAQGTIGSAANRIVVSADDGIVSAETVNTGGNIFLSSTGKLQLGKVKTNTGAASNEIVDIITTGAGAHLTLTFAENTNDDWKLTSAGNIAFAAGASLKANSADFQATGNITGGTTAHDIDTRGGAGPITLSGTALGSSPNHLQIAPGTASVNLTATTGGLYVDYSAGDIDGTLLRVSAVGANQAVEIGTIDGKIALNDAATFNANVANDNVVLTARGTTKNIDFSGTGSLAARSATLVASGAITSGTAATDISTGLGNLSLTAGTGIGAAGNRLNVTATSGTVSASSTTGNIYLESPSLLRVGTVATGAGVQDVEIYTLGGTTAHILLNAPINTNDNWTLNSSGDIDFNGGSIVAGSISATTAPTGKITSSGGAAIDIDTSAANGAILLDSGSIGAVVGMTVTPVLLNPGTGTLDLTARTGDLYAEIASGSLLTSKLIHFEVADGQNAWLKTTNGSITVDSTAGFVNIVDSQLTLIAGGAASTLDITDAATLVAQSVTLTAGDAITGGGAVLDIDTSAAMAGAGGPITLNGKSLGASGAGALQIQPANGQLRLTATDGDIWLKIAGGSLTTSNVQTLSVARNNATISLEVLAGQITLDSLAGFNANTNNDFFRLIANGAGGNVNFGANTLQASSARIETSGAINSGAGANTDLQATGNIDLLAAKGIGAGGTGNELTLVSSSGKVAAETTSAAAGEGDIYLTSPASLTLGVIKTSNGRMHAVHVSTTGATSDLNLDSPSTTNDDWTLSAGRNFGFTGTGTLVAQSVDILAAGTVSSLAGSTAVDINASSIKIDAASIGTEPNELVLNHNGGPLDLYARAGDIWTIYDTGDLSLANFTRLQVDGAHQIYLETRDGSVTLANSPNVINTADDDWIVIAGGTSRDIQFADGYTLLGKNIDLQATGKLLSGNAAVNDIEATGTYSLRGDGGIGAAGNPLRILTNGSDVSAQTTLATGDIYLESPSSLRLFNVQTDVATTQTISIATVGAATNHLFVTRPSGSQDNWSLNSSGDIRFLGAGSLDANKATLVAAGDITSGTAAIDIDTLAANGAISLTGNSLGASGNPLTVRMGTGNLSLTATGVAPTNDVYVEVTSGNVVGSKLAVNVPRAGATVWLRAADGAILLDNTAGLDANTQDDRFELTASGFNRNIEFQGATTLTADSVKLDASGSIVSGTAANDIVSNGPLGPNLRAVHAIGGAANPLMIASPGAVTALTVATDGDIYIGSIGQLRIGAIATNLANEQVVQFSTTGAGSDILFEDENLTSNDYWTLTSAGDIRFVTNPLGASAKLRASTATLVAAGNVLGSDAVVDIDTEAVNGRIAISAAGIGTAADALGLAPGDGMLNLVANTGDIHVDLYGTNIEASQFELLRANGVDVQVALNVRAGTLTLDGDLTNFANLGDDNLIFTASNDVAFSNTAPLLAAQANINAGGRIRSTVAGAHVDTSATGGAIALNSAGRIGDLGNRVGVRAGAGIVTATTTAGTGDIYLAGFGPTRLGLLSTAAGTQKVDITSTGNLAFAETNAGSDNWVLNSQGDIGFELDKTLTAASADFTAAGAITGGTAATDIDTESANGSITLKGNTIGTAADALGISPGNGQLAFTTVAGLWITQTSGELDFGRVQLSASGINVPVVFRTTDGNIVLRDVSGVSANLANDDLELTAGGANRNIVFGASTLRVGSAKLVASGSIVSSGGISIDTSGGVGIFPGTIDLSAGGGIGTSTDPFQVRTGLLNTNSTLDQHFSGQTAELRLGTLNAPTAMIFIEGGDALLLGTATTMQLVARNQTTLGGIGTVMGNLAMQDSSVLTPGLGPNLAGVITVNGTAMLEPGTTLVFDLNAPYAMPGRDYDRLVVQDSITLTGVELKLQGGQTLQTSVNDITLIEIVNPGVRATGELVQPGLRGTLVPITEGTEIRVGSFKSALTYESGDGNDIGIRDVSITPPIMIQAGPPPQFRLVAIARTELPPLLPTPPQPVIKPYEAPLVEPDAGQMNPRRVQVRILIPIDDEGGFSERIVLDLDVEWLTNLSGLFRVLPDDRYRIYLVLEGGEERRVMDVIVRGGKPFDPAELKQRVAPPVHKPAVPKASVPQAAPAEIRDDHEGARDEAAPTESSLPLTPPQSSGADSPITPPEAAELDDAAVLPPRYHRFGAAAAGAAVALATGTAGRKWEERVDRAAEQLGAEHAPRSFRLWRWMTHKEKASRP